MKRSQIALLIALALVAVGIFAAVPLGLLAPAELGFALQSLVIFGAILFLYVTIRMRGE